MTGTFWAGVLALPATLSLWGWQHSSPLPGPVLFLSPGKTRGPGGGPEGQPSKLVAVLGRGGAVVV